MRTIFTLIGFLFLFTASAELEFNSGPWNLRISEKNGAWIGLKYKGTELLANPSGQQTLNLNAAELKANKNFVDHSSGEAAGVAVLEAAMSEGEKELPVRLISHHFDPVNRKLILKYRSGSWNLEEKISFGAAGAENRICRKASFQSEENKELKFRNFRFSLFFPLKGDFYFPALFFTDQWWREDNRPQYPELHRERRKGNIVQINGSGNDRVKLSILSPKKNLSLILFADSRLDGANVRYRRMRENLQADWNFAAQGWALPGKRQYLAGAYLEAVEKDRVRTLRENCPKLLSDLGFRPPSDRPEWVQDAVIYGLSNEPFHLSKIADVALSVLPRMKQIGFNTTWYRPSEASTSRYSPIDYKVIEPKIGTWADYRAVNEKLHRDGIRVLQDLVPHGGGQLGFLLRGQSAAMMAFTEQGNVLDGWASDFNNPSWRKYMKDICEFYTADLKTDGFRVDAIYGSKTLRNWRKAGWPADIPGIASYGNQGKAYRKMLPALWKQTMKLEGGRLPALEYDRASLASSRGGINMNNAMREGAKRGNPDAALLLESAELPFTACGDFHYDRDIQSLWFKLRGLSPEEFTEELAIWLDEQKYVDTPGTIRMRYMETGVGESWPYRKWFGLEGDKAIRALCTFIHGVPMFYETFTEGEGIFLRKILKIRKGLVPFRRGSADYLAVKSSHPAVFTALRSTEANSALAAINFAPHPVVTTLSLPKKIFSGKLPIFDLMSGDQLKINTGKILLKLPAFGCAVLAEMPKLPEWEEKKNAISEPKKKEIPSVKETADTVLVQSNRYELVLDRKSGLVRSFRNQKDGVCASGDLFVRGTPSIAKPECRISSRNGKITVQFEKGNMKIVYHADCEGVRILADNDRAKTFALFFANAAEWELDSAEGMLADIMPENPIPRRCTIMPFSGKQRSLRDHTLLWSSSDLPWDWNRPELRIFGKSGGLSIDMRKGSGAQHLHHAMENKTGLCYLADFGGKNGSLEIALKPEAVHQDSVFGKAVEIGKELTLTNESYGWKIENSHYEIHLLRSNGVIRNLFAKKEGKRYPVLAKQNLTASKSMFRGMPYAAASMDPETTVKLEKENGVLKMKFTGELRSAYALGRDRLRLTTEYTFSDSPEIRTLFTLRPSAAFPGKPELIFNAEKERFQKFLRYALSASENIGSFRDESRGRNLRFKITKETPLLPRTDYQIALNLRTDGTACSAAEPEPAIPGPLKMDEGFEERCSLVSEKDGRRILYLQSEFDESLPWTAFYAAAVTPGIGKDGTCGMYLSWPNPTFIQEINPRILEKGSYSFSFDMKTSLIKERSIKEWSNKLLTVHPFLKNKLPLSAQIEYYTRDGRKKSVSKRWDLAKVFDWKYFSMDVKIPEEGFAPSLRITAMPEYAGELYIDNIQFRRLK